MALEQRPRTPERGDIIWVEFDPQVGHEQAGYRPAVVLTPYSYNDKVGKAIVCPVTNTPPRNAFELALPTGLKVTGTILCDQVKSIDWVARGADYRGRLPDSLLEDALTIVLTLIDPE